MYNILIYLILSLPLKGEGQWYCLAKVQDHIGVVMFQDIPGPPRVGFIGTGYRSRDSESDVWKTTDGGLNWQKSIINNLSNKWNYGIANFAFVDSLTGFFSSGFMRYNNNTGVYKTIDGGNNWSQIFNTIHAWTTNIYYHSPLDLLFVSQWGEYSYVSSDRGINFRALSNSTTNNGYAFINDLIGIVTVCTYDSGIPFRLKMKRTVDGGVTWTELPYAIEAWQPLAIPSQNAFLIASEYPTEIGAIWRSDDAGITWMNIANLPKNRGHIVGDDKVLYTQVFPTGIFQSVDGGYSWKNICGPGFEYEDTRMYYKDGYLYAHDFVITESEDIGRLWVNTSGSGSGERILIQYADGTREKSLSAGNSVQIELSLPPTLATLPWLVLDSVTVRLGYKDEMLSLQQIQSAPGWQVVESREDSSGTTIKLLRTSGPHTSVPIASVTFQTTLARDSSTDITITDVYYNAGAFTNCEPVASEQLHLTIDDQCGDEMLRDFLKQTAMLRIISIHPNPATDEITIEYETAIECEVSMQMTEEATGITFRTRQLQASKGRNIIKEDVSGIFNTGTYAIRLQRGRDAATARFVKQ
jgi:photosystem II stability/assembly factor-like uncharacterized protein